MLIACCDQHVRDWYQSQDTLTTIGNCHHCAGRITYQRQGVEHLSGLGHSPGYAAASAQLFGRVAQRAKDGNSRRPFAHTRKRSRHIGQSSFTEPVVGDGVCGCAGFLG
jgi:hypothetical protein